MCRSSLRIANDDDSWQTKTDDKNLWCGTPLNGVLKYIPICKPVNVANRSTKVLCAITANNLYPTSRIFERRSTEAICWVSKHSQQWLCTFYVCLLFHVHVDVVATDGWPLYKLDISFFTVSQPTPICTYRPTHWGPPVISYKLSLVVLSLRCRLIQAKQTLHHTTHINDRFFPSS